MIWTTSQSISVETLKLYQSCEIEPYSFHSSNINPIDNICRVIKKNSKGIIQKNELKSHVKSIYDRVYLV